MRSLVAATLVLGMVAVASPAFAQDQTPPPPPPAQHHSGPTVGGVSIWGILAYGNGFGVGARFAIPLGNSGLFANNPNISDQFAVELGGDVVFWNYAGFGTTVDIIPKVGAMWVFWLLNGRLGLYPKIDLGYHIYPVANAGYVYSGFWFEGVLGAIYRTGNFSLRGEIGSGMLKLGVALNF